MVRGSAAPDGEPLSSDSNTIAGAARTVPSGAGGGAEARTKGSDMMAFLAFAEPGNAGYARVSAPEVAAPAPRPVTPAEDRAEDRPVLTELERSVIGLARGDGLSTLRKPGRLSRTLELLFGVRISPMLADPKLEALRRVAVLSWKRGYAIASAEVKAFLAAGYSPAHYELIVDTIATARQAETRRGRR